MHPRAITLQIRVHFVDGSIWVKDSALLFVMRRSMLLEWEITIQNKIIGIRLCLTLVERLSNDYTHTIFRTQLLSARSLYAIVIVVGHI